MKKIFLLIFILSNYLFSQDKKIEISIVDAETHLPVENVNVKISEINISLLSDKEGKIFFLNDKLNQITLQLSRIGYKQSDFVLTKKTLEQNKKHILHIYSLPIQTSAIIITGEHSDYSIEEGAIPKVVLKGRELQKDLSSTLASTLKNELGAAMRSMGPAPSRPVLRGLSGDRIIISEDGIKNDDLSSTSPDHAVTIEPFTADRIEIVRGPSILLTSSVANGGIVKVIQDKIILKPISRLNGNAGVFYETANKGFLGSGLLIYPYKKFIFRGEANSKKAGNIFSPLGELKNSSFDVTTFDLSTSFVDEDFALGVSSKEYQTNYGIPGGFVGAHPNGVDIEIYKLQNSFKSEIKTDNDYFSELKINANQLYLRQKEFEKLGLIGADFLVEHYSVNMEASHSEFSILHNGKLSLSFDERKYKVGGFVFTPSTKMQNFALAFFESWKKNNFTYQVAGRTDYANIFPEIETIENKNKLFWINSFAFSVLYDLNTTSHFGMNLNKSERIPTIEELYSKGPHLAAYSFEIGNPDLKTEKSIGTELFYHFENDNYSLLFLGFNNYFYNFITPRNTGETNWATLLPIYKTSGMETNINGLEIELKYTSQKFINFSITSSYTEGIFLETKKPVPSIPPLKILFNTELKFDNYSFGLTSETVSKQTKVDQFELPTDGYSILNFHTQYVYLSGLNIFNFTINVENIFNKIYYNHLSRIKSIMPETGRNIRGIVRFYF